MHPEFQLREEHFVVIDTSDEAVRAGVADPSSAAPVLLATAGDAGDRPIQQGRVTDWAALETVWRNVLFSHLNVVKSRNHSPVLLTVHPTWSRFDRERVVQMFFESFNVPGLYLAEKPLMTAYGYGLLTGLVIDFNYDHTIVTPVVDTAIIGHAIRILPLGRYHIEKQLKQLLNSDSQFKRELSGKPIDQSVVDFLMYNMVEFAATTMDPDVHKGRKDRELARVESIYDGSKVSLGDVRTKAPEIIFTPKLIGMEQRGLAEVIYECMCACDPDKRIPLMEHVMLNGSFAQTKGLKSRLEKEMKRFLPLSEFTDEFQPRDIQFAKFPDYIEKLKERPEEACWLGSSITAKLIFPDIKNYISKSDYNQHGPSVLQLKGY